MKISASVVTYNNEKEIRGVLNSLINSSCINQMDIYVVDNCSSDNTIRTVEKEYPQVKIIRSHTNSGYGGGHNQAMRIADSEYHFVINPDIMFDSNLLENIVDYLNKNQEIALCIPGVYDLDGQLKYPPKRDPRLSYLIARYIHNSKISKKLMDKYAMKKEVDEATEPFEIEVCSGSFMAMRRSAAKKIGFFDERFFMYFEDMDISRSMRAVGKVMYLPQYKVLHEGKRAAHHSKSARKMLINSMNKYFRKWGLRI